MAPVKVRVDNHSHFAIAASWIRSSGARRVSDLLRPGKRILDIGAGGGLIDEYLERKHGCVLQLPHAHLIPWA